MNAILRNSNRHEVVLLGFGEYYPFPIDLQAALSDAGRYANYIFRKDYNDSAPSWT